MSEPFFRTLALGPDGRPLIEVWRCEAAGQQLVLSGSASVFEGNVIIQVEHRDGTARTLNTQARAGGPDRGEWSITLPAGEAAYITIGQEEMEEAAAKESRRIRFAASRPNGP